MNWGRKGAFWMVVVAVLWTATPASACVLAMMQPSGRPACCRAMVQDCTMSEMCTDASCCRISGRDAAVAPIPPYTPERSQKLALAPNPASLEPPAASSAICRNVLDVSPPKFSSGSISVLRI
jgi:hypothetical protein